MSRNTQQGSNETANQFNIEYSTKNETRLYFNFENKAHAISIGRNEKRGALDIIEEANRKISRINETEEAERKTEQHEKN